MYIYYIYQETLTENVRDLKCVNTPTAEGTGDKHLPCVSTDRSVTCSAVLEQITQKERGQEHCVVSRCQIRSRAHVTTRDDELKVKPDHVEDHGNRHEARHELHLKQQRSLVSPEGARDHADA